MMLFAISPRAAVWVLKRVVEIIASDMDEKGNGFKAIFIVSGGRRVSTIKIN